MDRKKIALRLGQSLVLFIIAYYLIYRNLVLNWHRLGEVDWHVHWFPFSASLIGISLIYTANTQIWRLVFRSLSHTDIPFWRSAYIWFISNLGRYLPGKVWQIAGMAAMARAEGAPAAAAATASVVGFVVSLIAGAAVGLVCFPVSAAGKYATYLAWAWIGLPVVLAFLHPALLNRLFGLAARISGKPISIGLYSQRDLLLWFTLNVLVWLVYGLCFHYFILSIVPDAGLALSDSVGIYAIGYIIGFLVVFAPGGIGVREAMFTGLLAASLGEVTATVVALISRLWLTLAELVPVVLLIGVCGMPGKPKGRAEPSEESEDGR
ncbi:MAG: lysylphosphatidylglycerol synthase domain-containing protein [Candidatus Glassbacteria bacterium]